MAEQHDRLSLCELKALVILAVAAGFLLLGSLFILAPRAGAALFGIPAPEGLGLAYLRAIGFRDLALSLYIASLALLSTRRALAIVLGLTTLIPLCDTALVAHAIGLSSPGHLALHGASALLFASLAAWINPPRAADQ